LSLIARIAALEKNAGGMNPSLVTIFWGAHFRAHRIDRLGSGLVSLQVPSSTDSYGEFDLMASLSAEQKRLVSVAGRVAIVQAANNPRDWRENNKH
jgi:hypothetical protein